GTNTVPSADGLYPITYINSTSFSIPLNITGSGTGGSAIVSTAASSSTNEVKPNRIYYSKEQQPEAVPLLNYFDVGAKDQPILRICPLRNSLFVFKQDGLFRVSGNTAPFTVELFDISTVLLAADSLGVANNVIYAWARQGVVQVSEAGVSPPISAPINSDITRLASSSFSNFASATWGVGYLSDNSYLLGTVSNTSDTIATI